MKFPQEMVSDWPALEDAQLSSWTKHSLNLEVFSLDPGKPPEI